MESMQSTMPDCNTHAFYTHSCARTGHDFCLGTRPHRGLCGPTQAVALCCPVICCLHQNFTETLSSLDHNLDVTILVIIATLTTMTDLFDTIITNTITTIDISTITISTKGFRRSESRPRLALDSKFVALGVAWGLWAPVRALNPGIFRYLLYDNASWE